MSLRTVRLVSTRNGLPVASRVPIACLLAVTFAVAVEAPRAQASGQARDLVGGVVRRHDAAPRADAPAVPPPPTAILPVLPPHRDAPLPIGTGREPQPLSPPSNLGAAPQAVTFFVNSVCKPAGAATSYVGEPSAALCRDIAFQTGNWYAATSIDSGKTWVHASPYTTFPASDGGFCCDQRTVYVPSRDITIWLLQYVRGPVHNRYRIAVARGRNNLMDAVWSYYDWIPEDFGYPANRWLDFPDLAYAQDHLHVAANVYDFANPVNLVGSVRWRISLNDLRDAVASPAWSYGTSATFGGFAYRFSNGVTGGKIWFGALLNTTTVRVYEHDEATAVNTWNDRTVAAFVNTPATAPGPDGRDWAGRCVGRIRGAYGNATEIGFLWGCNANGAARPQAYTRVSRFRTADRTNIADDDIWNPTSAFLYAAGCSNDTGATGGVIVIGGGTVYPQSAAFVVPAGASFAGLTATSISTGTHGPAGNQWGDYFTVMRHPLLPCSWIATGMAQNGGPQDAASEPRYVWFGDGPGCAPITVNLTVLSGPVNAVPITLAQTDLDGRKDGNTNFVRRFAPRQGYTLAAPIQFVSGTVGYVLDRWLVNGVGQPAGQALIDVPDIGVVGATAEVRYVAVRKVDVTSLHTTGGVNIAVSVLDLVGAQNGTTPFARFYRDQTLVRFTAPATAGGVPFKRWRVNGVDQTLGALTASVTLTRDSTAVAEYYEHVTGALTPFGVGCAGTSGVDLHTTSGTPETGQTVTHTLARGRPNSGAFFLVGASASVWLGLLLPLPLGPLAPGCTQYVAVDVPFGLGTNGAGGATFAFPIPSDTGLIDSHVYTQWWCLDPGANQLNLTFSNAIDTRVGGLR